MLCYLNPGRMPMSFLSRLLLGSKRPPFDLSLCLIANRPSFQDEQVFFSKIQRAVRGGVTCIQLRDHQNDFATVLKTAQYLKNVIKNVPLFINTPNPFQLVQMVGAEGIFLEEKYSPTEARKKLGDKAIIGLSVQTLQDVTDTTQMTEIDYISVKVGPSNKTCPKNDIIWGVKGLRIVRKLSPHRLVAVGGLNLDNVEPVYRELHPDDGVAMAGGLMDLDDPYRTAQKIRTIAQAAKRNP